MTSPEERSQSGPSEAAQGRDALSQAFYREKNVADFRQKPADSLFVIIRKCVRFLLPLLCMLIALDMAFRWLLPPEKLLPYMQKSLACYTIKVDRLSSSPAPDLLFLGSSRARDAIVPQVFENGLEQVWKRPVRVFNAGLAGARMEEYCALASSHLPDPPPPYVVIGLSGSEIARVHDFRYASRFLWNTSGFYNYLNRTSFSDFKVKHIEYFIESLVCRLCYVFKYRDAHTALLKETLADLLRLNENEPEWSKADREIKRKRLVEHVLADDGYSLLVPSKNTLEEKLKIHKKLPIRNQDELDRDPDIFNEASVTLIKTLVSCFRNKGVKVAFAEVPPSPYLQDMNPVLLGEEFRMRMTEEVKKLDVPFFTFPPEEIELTNRHYGDPSHFNRDGARQYSKQLLEKLYRAGFFDKKAQ